MTCVGILGHIQSMAKASLTQVFDCSLQEFYAVVSNYEGYSQFLPEVKAARIVRHDGAIKVVDFKLELIKSFSYQLKMREEKNKISWSLEGGDIFKTNDGSWQLEPEGDKTRATYSIEVKTKMFVPSFVTKKLIDVSLPNMMQAYKKRIVDLYAR